MATEIKIVTEIDPRTGEVIVAESESQAKFILAMKRVGRELREKEGIVL